MSLRTPLEDWRYKRFLKSGEGVPLNELPAIKEWNYWKLVEPISIYNRHHTKHLMLVLKRECSNPWELHHYELAELWYKVLKNMDDEYDYAKVNFRQMRSVHGYVHLHVLNLKRKYQ